MAAEIADQREIRVVRLRPGQRKIVVNAGNGLHPPAIAIGEAGAVDVLRAAHVGRAVLAEGNGIVGGQAAGHACAPEQLVADRAVDDLVDLGQIVEAALRVGVHAGDELQLRLAEVRRDVRMRQCRAQQHRMRHGRELAVRPHAQTFLLDAAAQSLQCSRGQRIQALCKGHGVLDGCWMQDRRRRARRGCLRVRERWTGCALYNGRPKAP